MPEHPLLVFKKSSVINSRRPPSGGGGTILPSYGRQAERLAPNFSELERALRAKTLELQTDPEGVVQEQVLVLKTVGTVSDFADAVAAIPGMEWLAEFDEEDIPPDEDFYKIKPSDKSRKEDPLSGRLYLLMSNHAALQELLRIWQTFQNNPNARLRTGLGVWRQIFKHLSEVRLWDVQDRFENTGALEDWEDQLERGAETIRFQLEPWYKKTTTDRAIVGQKIRELIGHENGRLLAEYTLSEIAYQGFLAELPAAKVRQMLESRDTHILHCEYIMFARPLGQGVVALTDLSDVVDAVENNNNVPQAEPRVALLDGLPIQNHALLRDRLTVSDPDEFASEYLAADRVHGTAMACSILHGDGALNEPIKSKLYVRPVLKPGHADFQGRKREVVPNDSLEVDLLHRCVRRIYEGELGAAGDAATVKIINYSVGDPVRQFDHILSPVARLIDWLSWQYNVLFIVSAGNHLTELPLQCEKEAFKRMSPQEKQDVVLKHLIQESRNRRLLSPAESINALTVGASNTDNSVARETDLRFPLLLEADLPAPYSAFGLGYRRAIKPDLLVSGGRLFFGEKIDGEANLTLQPSFVSQAPGYLLACPGTGNANKCAHYRGTSFAAGISAYYGEKVIEKLEVLSVTNPDLSEEYFALLVKNLLVHSSSWRNGKSHVESAIQTQVKKQKQREFISRLLGYGVADFKRVLGCTDQRATLIACDSIVSGQGHVFEIPLPKDLSGKREWRRVTATLAWFTPTNSMQRPYRKAALWMSNIEGAVLKVDREEADNKASMRGTIQHEVLEGDKAVPLRDGSTMKIQVNCREDATPLVERIRYSLAVTVEVKEGISVRVYDQMKAKIVVAPVRQVVRT